MIDAIRRLIEIDDALSACIVTGSDKVQNGFGNGDCLLMDFKHGIFVVADAAERFPEASRDLLERLFLELTNTETPDTPSGWTACIESAWAAQKYIHKTTFGFLAISGRDDGLDAFMAHGGDSVMAILDARTGSIEYKTDPDMNFAGRSRRPPAIEKVPLDNHDVRILLATDGLSDVIRHHYDGRPPALPEELLSRPVHLAAGAVHRAIEESRGKLPHDDIGMILLDPFKIGTIEHRPILMGGTSPDAEAEYAKLKMKSSKPTPRLRPQTPPCSDLLEIVGIKEL